MKIEVVAMALAWTYIGITEAQLGVSLPDLSCISPRSTSMHLTLNSHRNQTGHWNAEIRVDHGAEQSKDPDKSTAPWTVDVEHITAVCESAESVQIIAKLSTPPPRAGPGYELYPGVGYYKFHTGGHTWEEARTKCAQEGAHLAIVDSDAESAILQKLFTRNTKRQNVSNNDFAMIGFHDMYNEGQYITIFGVAPGYPMTGEMTTGHEYGLAGGKNRKVLAKIGIDAN